MAPPPITEEISTREIAVQLVKALGRIEKAVGDNDTTKVLRELLAKITDISAKAKGDKGDDGYTPKKDKDYRDGKDGRGIARVDIDEQGRLAVVFTDGKEKKFGRIVGKDGKDAKVDIEALAKKVLAAVEVPTVDLDALASAAAAKLGKLPTLEQIVAGIKKDIGYGDLKDRPDLDSIIRKHIGEFYEQQDRGVYAAPGNAGGAPIAIYDEGVLVSDSVRSIDFRGSSVEITDLGDGNLVATFTGGAGVRPKTQEVTGTQDGDNVRIALSQLDFTPDSYEWLSRNGQVLSPGPAQPDGEYSSWEIDGTDIVVYWALTSDRFLFNYTYTA